MAAVRAGVFGWGIVAPKSPNISAFARNLASSGSWLSPFDGFGPCNFLTGTPEFRFDEYREWIDRRFAPRHFQTLKSKMDLPTLYALGAFIQALAQNPGVEGELKSLGGQAHVYVGTGLGSLDTIYRESIALYEAQKRWNRFWAQPERNRALGAYLAQNPGAREAGVPAHPDTVSAGERDAAEQAWFHYWTARSPELHEYLGELAEIEGLKIEGGIAAGKLNAIREKEKRRARMQEHWKAPEPPWKVSANLIWNIHNAPAAQISILGKITGLAFAPVAACSTFGVTLKLAMQAIQSGEAKMVVVGATDGPPHPLTVGSFYSARVLAADGTVSVPLTHYQGTHVSGGSVVWVLGDLDYCRAKGFRPLGMEPLAVGVSSDAYHIITPSSDGPKRAMMQALADAGAPPAAVGTWDLHATATPGDYSEVATFRSIFPDSVCVTARKGTFGHGMSAGGGWELTAQYLGAEAGQLFPTPLRERYLNPAIAEVHDRIVFDTGRGFPPGLAGKLSMGIGGINACVISRPWSERD
ncbi:MAG TPA: beta-ketoacyl synthase N-terminal-like domain-containing protein [Candidatus Solibacter sp.]|nr:beta-ketoacyl synthase N-terminal-like domain-containing protein [Candidatus Solibacter sp.]